MTDSTAPSERTTADPLKRQLIRFIVVGCTAVIVDFLGYMLLLNIFEHAPAKTLSFIAGTIVAYIFNKYWTFQKGDTGHADLIKFIFLYSVTLGANVLINQISILLLPQYLLLAFLFATGTSTVLNFIGQKWWVFKV